MPVFIASLWKVTLVLLAAGCLSLGMVRASASVRHLVWIFALFGVLVIPVLSLFIPTWTVALWSDMLPGREPALFRVDAASTAMASAVEPDSPASVGRAPAGLVPSLAGGSRVSLLALVWFGGSMAVIFWMAMEFAAVVRVRRRAHPARRAVRSLAQELCDQLGVKLHVRVFESDAATTPMSWGVFRPVILLPAVAVASAGLLRSALVHELTHVKRQDYLLQLIGQVCCALYWFHPLVWVAQREALRLRERAADDRVLRFGIGPADYASLLLAVARSMRPPRLCGSLAMVRSPRLESRVRAILDPCLRRNELTRAAVPVGVFFAALVAVSLSAVRPVLAGIPALPLPPAAFRIVAPAITLAPAAPPETDVAALESEARKLADSFEFEKAAELYRRAAEIRKQSFGPTSTDYAKGLEQLGAFYRTWDRINEARDCYRAALSILEPNLGSSHPGLFDAVYFLAIESHSRGDKTAAETLYQRALDLWKPLAGNETALALHGLALVAEDRGEMEKAAELLDEADQFALPGSSVKWLVLCSKARILRTLGRDAEADAAAKASVAASDNWKNAVVASRPEAYRLPLRETTAQRVGQGVSAPSLVSKVEPQYSREARVNKVQGTVVLQAIVEEDGRIRDVCVTRPIGFGLNEQAVTAVRQWQFKPGFKDGMPVAVQATIEVNFRLL